MRHYPLFDGPHNQALRLAVPLRQLGWDTIVVLPNEPGNAAQRLADAEIKVVQIPLCRLRAVRDPAFIANWAFNMVKDVIRLRRVIRDQRADVVMLSGIWNIQAAIASRLERVPIVWQLVDTRTPPVVRRILMPIVTGLAEVVMTTGLQVAKVHSGALSMGDRLVTYYPPVDLQLFRASVSLKQAARRKLGIRDDELVVGTVGNINPQKGQLAFIRAAAQLRHVVPSLRFAILGATYSHHSGYAARLWKEAAALGLTIGRDLITLDPGARVWELAQAFDLFWLTSEPRSEGIPTAVEEAMALSIPVVGFDVGAVSELIDDGVSGFLVPALDIESLVSSSVRLLRDPARRQRMGVAARHRVVSVASLEISAAAHYRALMVAVVGRSQHAGSVAPASSEEVKKVADLP